MTTPNPIPDMQVTTAADGTLIYSWEDGVVVQVLFHQANKRGHPLVKVTYQATLINTTHVDLLSLLDRERLHAHCSAEEDKVEWLQRFMLVADDLSTRKTDTPARILTITWLSTVQPARVEYLWKPYLPQGRPVGLVGDPGVGKSALVMKIAAHVTTGLAFPSLIDGVIPHDFPPRNVLFFTAEDDLADTLRPRLEASGGDASKLGHVTSRLKDTEAESVVSMQDLDLIRQALEDHTPALLVFDPIQSFLGRGVDMNKANETRPVLDALVGLCKQYNCTTLFVRHIGKAQQDKTTSLGLGSIDITANFRSVLVLGYDPDDPKGPRRILAHAKSNTAAMGRSLAYKMLSTEQVFTTDTGDRITYEAPRLEWDGASSLTAEDLMSTPVHEADEETSALQQAKAFLTEFLGEGAQLYSDITSASKEAGISKRTLDRAKPLLDVKARRRSLNDTPSKDWPWEWYLSGNDKNTC